MSGLEEAASRRVFLSVRHCLSFLLLLGFTASGCSPAQYAQQADRSAGKVISWGQESALGKSESFDVRYHPFTCEDRNDPGVILIGKKRIAIGTGPKQSLTPAECLEIAFRNSRELQLQKEDLFKSALALANARRGWNFPLLTGDLTGSVERSRQEGTTGWENSADAELGLSALQKLRGGAQISLATTISLASDLLGADSTTIGSLIEANLTQPLLRGAWRDLAYEDQYRLERDFVISVFKYKRFIETFAAEVLTSYYKVLQKRDRLKNEQANIKRLTETLALTRLLVQGGQVSRIQQDQAEQNLLEARVRYQQSQQSYRNALDEFKMTIGLPVGAMIELDYPDTLIKLNKAGPAPIPFKEDEAIQIAFSSRPDVLEEKAAVRDSAKDVEIAADAFLPQLDVVLGYSAPGGRRKRDFWNVQFHRHTRLAGVNFEYELDQTDNRDAYRNAIIAYNKARRDWEELCDRVRLEVRQSYRLLIQSRKSYELQLRNVKIALRRRKLAALQQKEGQASARDVLEAEEALRSAQNGLTSALIDYTTTRLKFLASLGMLEVDEKGFIHERKEPLTYGRIEQQYRCGIPEQKDDRLDSQ